MKFYCKNVKGHVQFEQPLVFVMYLADLMTLLAVTCIVSFVVILNELCICLGVELLHSSVLLTCLSTFMPFPVSLYKSPLSHFVHIYSTNDTIFLYGC